MKKLLFFVTCWVMSTAHAQQTPITPVDIPTFGNQQFFLTAPFDIYSPYLTNGPVVADQGSHVDFVAGRSIHLGDGFRAGQYVNDGYFHAHIGPAADFDVVFIEPNQPYPQVGQFEKLEIGMTLPASLEQQVNDFLANGTGGINPFDPDQISVEAVFTCGNNQSKAYAFYYSDYTRDPNTLDPYTPANWIEQSTSYHWRIRFAPKYLGAWSCSISIHINGSQVSTNSVDNLVFSCVHSSNPGFLEVANDHRHLKFSGSNGCFFAIGQNVAWCNSYFVGGPSSVSNRLRDDGILDLEHYYDDIANNGGNFGRFIITPDFGEIEWHRPGNIHPELGNYSEGLDHAWELDQLFELCESDDLYFMLNLAFQGEFRTDNGPSSGWNNNPYHLYIPGVQDPKDLYMNTSVIGEVRRNFKNKLRYYFSRWGYSTSLGVFQLFSEFGNWEGDGDLSQNQAKLIDGDNFMSYLATEIKNMDQGRDHLISAIYGGDGALPWQLDDGAGTLINGAHNIFDFQSIDLVSANIYHTERYSAYSYFKDYNGCIGCSPFDRRIFDYWDKPAILTEMGIFHVDEDSNGRPIADEGDISGCSDITFHNYMWSTAFSNGYGTGLNWWQWFNDDYRAQNYPAISHFFSDIDLIAGNFNDPGRWSDGLIPSSGNAILETTYIKSENNKHVIGWAHNMTYWWGNIDQNCTDRYGNVMPIVNAHNDDNYSSPQQIDITKHVRFEGMDVGRYKVNLFSTRGQGANLGGEFHVFTDILGDLDINWIVGDIADFSVKADFDPLLNFRTSSNIFDTVYYCQFDSVSSKGNFLSDSIGKLNYQWFINDSIYSTTQHPNFHFDHTGFYNIRVEVSDTAYQLGVFSQCFVVENCEEGGSQRLIGNNQELDSIQSSIYVWPNPTFDNVYIRLCNDENIKSIVITDVDGRSINVKYQIIGNSYQVDLSEVDAGSYFIMVESQNKRYFKRLIKLN